MSGGGSPWWRCRDRRYVIFAIPGRERFRIDPSHLAVTASGIAIGLVAVGGDHEAAWWIQAECWGSADIVEIRVWWRNR